MDNKGLALITCSAVGLGVVIGSSAPALLPAGHSLVALASFIATINLTRARKRQ